MITIEATVPCVEIPAWAVMERRLFDLLNEAVEPFLQKYTRADGSLVWDQGPDAAWQGRDGADDFYESFFNWPLLYLLGGGDHLLPLSHRHWDAVTRQLTDLGLVYKEYERGYDQFHQSESYLYFYFLCLADPANPTLIERARRFAGLYMNEDPDAPNYDPERHIIRAPHNGSTGPRWGFTDDEPIYSWSAGMAIYGLPYSDVEGCATFDDLRDPQNARRMGQVMHERLGRGDVVANLGVTSLLTNAYLLTGDPKYQRWVVEYVDAWVERARQNGGLLPDNVGLSGQVGEYLGGKWYGGLYGWTWPHGFYNIGMTAVVAAINAALVSGNHMYLDLARTQIDRVMALGEVRDRDELSMSLGHHWIGQLSALGERREVFVVPYRYGDAGWFDYQVMSPICPTAIWSFSQSPADWERLERLRAQDGYDWGKVIPFRSKEESGHEQPWLRFLAGENPEYPYAILSASYAQVCRRLALIEADTEPTDQIDVHHWQNLNPILTEALVQLTLGAPQVIYNGGLLVAPLRYFDAERRRPGLPADVAALVERVEPTSLRVRLINLSGIAKRTLMIQAGAFGEHRFTQARYDDRVSDYPGALRSYAAPPLQTEPRQIDINNTYLVVTLPPGHEITLDVGIERFVNTPSYALPWKDA